MAGVKVQLTICICVFAVFLDENNKEHQVLLGINPPYDEEHFDADSHVAYITDLLHISYGKEVKEEGIFILMISLLLKGLSYMSMPMRKKLTTKKWPLIMLLEHERNKKLIQLVYLLIWT
jgi:hypothetical protein